MSTDQKFQTTSRFLVSHLKLTILLDISNDTELIEISTSTFRSKWFFESDLNIVYHSVVQSCIYDWVSEPHNK